MGPQRTRYPSPDEQRMNTWDYKGHEKVELLETKLLQGRFVPDQSCGVFIRV